MKKQTKIDSRLGHIDIYINNSKSLLLAIPHGYVGPELVKKDLQFMSEFDQSSEKEWTYIVDTSRAKVVNPINPILLRRLKQFSNMKEYVVFAPSRFVRGMLRLSSWLNKPDRIIREREQLQMELDKYG